MILKSFELNKIKLKNYKFYLFYGDNEGLKEETIKNLFEKNYLNNINRISASSLGNKNNFFNSVLTKSFFDNEKLIIVNRAI